MAVSASGADQDELLRYSTPWCGLPGTRCTYRFSTRSTGRQSSPSSRASMCGLYQSCCRCCLSLALVSVFPGGYQQVSVGLAEYAIFIAAKVDEVQPWFIGDRRLGIQFDLTVGDAVDFQPRVDVQSVLATEPGLTQLWVGLLQVIGGGEDHIVNLDPDLRMFASQHHDIEHWIVLAWQPRGSSAIFGCIW